MSLVLEKTHLGSSLSSSRCVTSGRWCNLFRPLFPSLEGGGLAQWLCLGQSRLQFGEDAWQQETGPAIPGDREKSSVQRPVFIPLKGRTVSTSAMATRWVCCVSEKIGPHPKPCTCDCDLVWIYGVFADVIQLKVLRQGHSAWRVGLKSSNCCS